VTTPPPILYQPSFDELDEPLRETTFVVVDLETTGGSAAESEITEVGAVKVRGGEVLGEFQSLVRPRAAIPPFIAVLTGITDRMVASAPPIGAVLPAFLEFARGAVLVAHNAPFDLSFLRAACADAGYPWPRFAHVDTARLARRVVTKDETPDCRLATLAQLFKAGTTPTHRALADARATVDVLHALFERLGSLGVHSLPELHAFAAAVPPEQRAKRYLAYDLPTGPGVYIFRDAAGEALYIGRSRHIRTRVRTYFTASEPRTRMAEMVTLATRVDAVPCAHELEAQVRELRMIAEYGPRFNRRSRRPERALYLKVTKEAFPRLSQVRTLGKDGAAYLGPFGGTKDAERAAAAVYETVPLRQCGGRLSLSRLRPACVLKDIGRCGAPCDGSESKDQYAGHVAAVVQAVTRDVSAVVRAVSGRIDHHTRAGRYEDAALHRDRLASFLRAALRVQRHTALSGAAELVAASPAGGGWDLAVVRFGRLAGAGSVPYGAAPRPYIDALRASAETVVPGHGPTPASSAEEVDCLLRWLERPGVRLVSLDGEWSSPAFGAGRLARWLASVERAGPAARPLDDRRRLRPTGPRVPRWKE
jgi:DNA polymerase-3 subunit epsilon